MGTWGTGIFDNDLAGDLRYAFEYELLGGADVKTATERVLQRFALEKDEDEALVGYLVLAGLQLEYDALQPDIRYKALRIVRSGQALEGWDADPTSPEYIERKQVLDEFQSKLLRPKTAARFAKDLDEWKNAQLTRRRAQLGDIIAVPLGENSVAAGLVLSRFDRFKNSIMVGFYDHVFRSVAEIDARDLGGDFVMTPNYVPEVFATDGPWTIVGNSQELLEAARIPELRNVNSLYHGNKYVRQLTDEETADYPEGTIESDRYLENMLREHFGLS